MNSIKLVSTCVGWCEWLVQCKLASLEVRVLTSVCKIPPCYWALQCCMVRVGGVEGHSCFSFKYGFIFTHVYQAKERRHNEEGTSRLWTGMLTAGDELKMKNRTWDSGFQTVECRSSLQLTADVRWKFSFAFWMRHWDLYTRLSAQIPRSEKELVLKEQKATHLVFSALQTCFFVFLCLQIAQVSHLF